MSRKVTTTEKFDKDGKLIEKTVITEEDETIRPYVQPYTWTMPWYKQSASSTMKQFQHNHSTLS